jgi:hypothetical protein
MHKPTEDERKTFARAKASNGISIRAVRKLRQRGEISSKPAEMPQMQPAGEREVRFRPRWDDHQSNDHKWRHRYGVPQ